MVASKTRLPATDAPFARVGYSGAAAIPKRPRQEDTAAPPRGQTVSPWAYGSELSGVTRNGVGLSPVSVAGRCAQAMPPVTQRVPPTNRNVSGARVHPQCFSGLGSLAHPSRPKRGTSRTVLAWPLRQRPLLDAAGCIVFPEGRFEQGFPYRYGPARVGLGRTAARPHRMRLN
jgi:hypothetical protein